MEEYMSLLNNLDHGPGQCLGLFLASQRTQKQCAAEFLLWSMFSDTVKRRNETQLTEGKRWKENKLFLKWEERATLTGWNEQHWMGSIYGNVIICVLCVEHFMCIRSFQFLRSRVFPSRLVTQMLADGKMLVQSCWVMWGQGHLLLQFLGPDPGYPTSACHW